MTEELARRIISLEMDVELLRDLSCSDLDYYGYLIDEAESIKEDFGVEHPSLSIWKRKWANEHAKCHFSELLTLEVADIIISPSFMGVQLPSFDLIRAEHV